MPAEPRKKKKTGFYPVREMRLPEMGAPEPLEARHKREMERIEKELRRLHAQQSQEIEGLERDMMRAGVPGKDIARIKFKLLTATDDAHKKAFAERRRSLSEKELGESDLREIAMVIEGAEEIQNIAEEADGLMDAAKKPKGVLAKLKEVQQGEQLEGTDEAEEELKKRIAAEKAVDFASEVAVLPPGKRPTSFMGLEEPLDKKKKKKKDDPGDYRYG